MSTPTETEFREWLNGSAICRVRECGHSLLTVPGCAECQTFLESITSPKTLDERLAEKEKRIKRKIEASLRRQGKLARRYEANKLPMDTIDEWLAKRLPPKK